MTDTTMGGGPGVGIRLFVHGGEVAKRMFDQVGDSGRKMWAQIALGEKAANPALRALSTLTGSAKQGVQDLANRAGVAGQALSAFGATGVAVAAILGGLAVALVKVREGMQFAADLTDTADRIGVGVEALQRWRYASDEAGVSVETFQANLEKLNGMVGAFKIGIGDGRLKPIFEELGITKAQLANVKTAEEMMLLLADTLGQVQDRAVQVRLARGLGVEDSLPILRLGSERIRELGDEAARLGLVMSKDVVKALDDADRKLEIAQQRIDMSMRLAVAGLADDFASLVTQIADVVQWLGRLNAIKIENPGAVAGRGLNRWFRDRFAGRSSAEGREHWGRRDDPLSPEEEASTQALLESMIGGFELKTEPGFEPKGHNSGGKGRAQQQAEREAEQRRQRQRRFEQELERLQAEILRSGDRALLSIDDLAAADVAELRDEQRRKLKEIVEAEAEYARSNGLRGLSQVEAEQLRAAQAELTEQKIGVREWKRRHDQARRRLDLEGQAAEAAIELLDLDAQMVRDGRERSRLEREILVATLALARKRKAAELDEDNDLTPEEREALMAGFDRASTRRLAVFDHGEDERLRASFKSYGREVVTAIEAGRIGEKIGEDIRARLIDAMLDSAFDLFGRMQAGGGKGGAAGLLGQAASWGFSLFGRGGGRAGGGGARAGFVYEAAEHGRPELFMLGGGGHVTSAAETARMLRDLWGDGSQAESGGLTVTMPDIRIDARGADPAGLARVEAQVARLRQEMPGMAVAAVSEFQGRRGGRTGGGVF